MYDLWRLLTVSGTFAQDYDSALHWKHVCTIWIQVGTHCCVVYHRVCAWTDWIWSIIFWLYICLFQQRH